MAEKEEILIEIVVSNEQATKAIFESQQAIARMKNAQTELTKARKDGSITDEEYSKKSTAIKVAIDQQKESIRQNEKELRNNIKAQKDNTDSLASLRAQLSNSVKDFDNLSKAEREGAKGKELQSSINELMTTLENAEQATGRFQRQVGKYPESMGQAGQGVQKITGFLGKMGDQISTVNPVVGGFINSIGGFAAKAAAASEGVEELSTSIVQSGEGIKSVEGFAGKASGSLENLSDTASDSGKIVSAGFSAITSGAKSMAMAFLSPPIIIISSVILAIVGAFKLLQKGFSLNDEAADKLEDSFAILQPIFTAIAEAATYLAEGVADVVHFFSEMTAKGIDTIAGLFGIKTGMEAAAQSARDLLQAERDLEDAENEFIVTSAKRALDRAKLIAEVMDKENFTAEERIARLKDASALDKADLEDKKRMAAENLRIIEEKAKQENKYTKEVEDNIAQAKARSLNAEREYFEGVKEINKKLSAAESELAAERKAAYDDYVKRLKERQDKERQALQQLEDLTIGLIKEDLARQIESEKVKTQRANEAIKERLKNEENLTKEARKALEQIILINEQNLDTKITELKEKQREDNIKKELEARQRELQAKLEIQEKGSKDELNLKIAKLRLQSSIELENKNLTEVEKRAITKRFQEEEDKLNQDFLAKKFTDLQKKVDEEFKLKQLQFENNNALEEEKLVIELEREQKKYQSLVALDEKTKLALYGNQLNYQIAVEESLNRVKNAQNNVTQAQINTLNSFNMAMQSISSNINTIMTALVEDSEEFATYQKGLALFNIAIALSTSLANVVKVATQSSFTVYDLIANIIAGTASVVTSISSAKKAFNEGNKPNKPKFATGGLIVGQGTGTSDSIEARVSNGESIINSNSTSMFSPILSALNQAGGGVGFGAQTVSQQVQGEDMLARAFAKGVSMLPNPVVSVKEINTTNERVKVLESL